MKTLEEFKAKYDTKLKVNELAMSYDNYVLAYNKALQLLKSRKLIK